MNVKVFLKFNRNDPSAYLCLQYWLELFQKYDTTIICDLYDTVTQTMPAKLSKAIHGYKVKIINTDYQQFIVPYFKSKKQKMASANYEAFRLKESSDLIWIIDADDTMFLSTDYEGLRGRLKKAEQYLISNKLDGFSLDFYREYNDTWTFGVACFNSNLNWNKVKSVTADNIEHYNLPMNIDSMFDVLKRKNQLRLESFVFPGYAFQHLINNFRKLNVGVYFWSGAAKGKPARLWDTPLHPEVIEIV